MVVIKGTIREKIDDDAIVALGNHDLKGMVTGTLYVNDGSHILIHGLISKNMVLTCGASASIPGTVVGTVEVGLGASVTVAGMVGNLIGDGHIEIKHGAIINGVKY